MTGAPAINTGHISQERHSRYHGEGWVHRTGGVVDPISRFAITGCEGLLVSSLGLPVDISHNIVIVKGVGKTRNKNKQLSSRPTEEEELSPLDKLTFPARN
mgnify:CR=1 FL=1|jgi:hypothetical protein